MRDVLGWQPDWMSSSEREASRPLAQRSPLLLFDFWTRKNMCNLHLPSWSCLSVASPCPALLWPSEFWWQCSSAHSFMSRAPFLLLSPQTLLPACQLWTSALSLSSCVNFKSPCLLSLSVKNNRCGIWVQIIKFRAWVLSFSSALYQRPWGLTGPLLVGETCPGREAGPGLLHTLPLAP